ncbi:MAG: shikimate kinase [Hydrogenophilaceae bacterium]|jgi:chloramphenicol 3-O-phosphotransferase|nr:shikimate kinase [Hydrogenophilaceae bacterium]
MRLVFLYGPPAAGKHTIGGLLSEKASLPLFHNHLIVDAVAAVFPFGGPTFVRLREAFWVETIAAACAEGRSLIFTFQPEPSVSEGFPERVAALVRDSGGRILFVHLAAPLAAQEARIANADRARFGKLRDVGLLRALHADFAACEAAMPQPDLVIDTSMTAPAEAAERIHALLGGDGRR